MRAHEVSLRQMGDLPVWLISTRSHTTLAMTFVRMQEHYESASKKFQGKIFTLEDYRKWYVKKHGKWSYANDWSGFNVPSSVVCTVLRQFPDHSKEEAYVFQKLEELGVFQHERFYLIGARTGEWPTLQHELRHALYYLNEAYRAEVNEVLGRFPTRSLSRLLKKMGYTESVILDEKQAYALTGWPSRLSRVTKEMRLLKKELRKIEKKYLHLLPA